MMMNAETTGSVMCRRLCHPAELSIEVASYPSPGHATSPAVEMSVVPGVGCHAVTIAPDSRAQSGFARIETDSASEPMDCPRPGTVLANRYWNTKAMTMPEMTIGIT